MRYLICILSSLLVSGCAAELEPSNYTQHPKNYRDLVRNELTNYLKDPDSAKNAQISKPYRTTGLVPGEWGICVKLNAKNSFGGYTGMRAYWLAMDSEKVLGVWPDNIAYHCTGETKYEEFAEMNGSAT